MIPGERKEKHYYVQKTARPEKGKVYPRAYGNAHKDPNYEQTTLSPEEIAIFKAIDFGIYPLSPSEGKWHMEQGFKNMMSLTGALLAIHDWDKTLADDPRFLKDENGKLLPEYDPRKAIKISDVDWGLGSRGAYAFFSKKRSIKEFLERFDERMSRQNVNPLAQKKAHEFLEKQLQELAPVYDNIFKLYNEDFFTQWVRGEFKYKHPILDTPKAQEDFRQSMRILLASYPGDYLGEPQEASTIVWTAVDKLMERLIEHETGLRLKREAELEAKEQKAAAKRARDEAREREQQAADAAKKDAERKAFMAVHQPYPLSFSAKSLVGFLQQVQSNSLAAGWMATELSALTEMLDIREEHQKALGDLVLSPSNIARTALAMGASYDRLKQEAATNHLEENAQKLARLCQDEKVAQTVQTMEQTDSGTLFLACLLLEPATYSNYTQALLAPARWQAQLDALVTRYMHAEQCSQHDVLTLAGDPDCAKDDARLADIAHVRDMLKKAQALDLNSARQALTAQVQEAMQGHWEAQAQSVLNAEPDALAAPNQNARRLALQEPEQPVETRPKQGWLVEMRENFTWEATPNDPLSVRIRNAQDPSIFADICPSAPESDVEFKRLITELTSEFAHKAATHSLIETLTNDAGFTFDSSTQTLRHSVYDNMIETLTGTYREQVAQISALSERFQEALFRQEASVETARALGITTPEDKYLSHAQMDALQQKMDAAQLKPDDTSTALSKLEKGKTVSDKKVWKTESNENLLIFDSSTLFKLCARRNAGGDSWMDMIRCTAKLPNVKVLIPSVVADFEMRGQVPVFDSHGNYKENVQVDERFISNTHPFMEKHFTNMNPIAESATRIMIPGNGGQPYIERQGDPNIIIVDTPKDKELWTKIMSLKRRHADRDAHVLYSVLAENIYGNGEGERAINRVIEACPYKNPMTIISDDLRYLKGHAGAKPDEVAPLTSPLGMPVGQCSTDMYLKAEASNPKRIAQLQAELEHPSPPLFWRIADDLRREGRKNNDSDWDLFLNHIDAGRHMNGEHGAHIHRIIGTGVRQAAGEATAPQDLRPATPAPWQKPEEKGWLAKLEEDLRRASGEGSNLPPH